MNIPNRYGYDLWLTIACIALKILSCNILYSRSSVDKEQAKRSGRRAYCECYRC